jgi:secreted Zn-dependent insulinase-like peptidase
MPFAPEGLHYGVDSSVVGWQLNASGYSHKLPHLVHLVLERMTHLKVDPTRFKVTSLMGPYHVLIATLAFPLCTA